MKKLFTLLTAAMLCSFGIGLQASELTVANGTNTSYKIPYAPSSATSYQRAQVIYAAEDLADMNGSSIYQMTFYTSSEIATNWGDALFRVSLAEVTETDFGSVDDAAAFISADTTKVYSGQFSMAGDELVIEFKKPYAYGGGNLLLEVELILQGTNTSAYFYGTNTTAGGPIHGVIGTNVFYSTITDVDKYGGKQRFIPKTTFAYGTKSSCTKPTGLIAYNVTNNSAKIGWTTEEVESCTLEYKKMGKYNKWTTIANASNGTTLSDLAESTTYLVRLKKDCGEEGISAYTTTSFFTPCAPQPAGDLPYTYDFESVSINDIPVCWDKIANGNYPAVQMTSTYGSAYAGDKYLYLYGGTSTSACVIIFPTYETPYSDLAISFWYKNESAGEDYGYGQIGYVTDKRFASTFVAIENLAQVTEYTHVENVALAAIPSSAYLAIRIGNSPKYSSKLFLDDVIISSATPTCSKPAGLAVSDILYNGATVTWEKGSAKSSILQYKRSDAEEWTTINNAVSPYELTGLEASTSYDVRVKNTCGEIGESDYCAIVDFETPCAPFFADSENPFSEGFEGLAKNTIPDCWDKSEKSGYMSAWGTLSTHHSGSQGAYAIFDFSDKDDYAVLKSSPIYINSTATLTFWYMNTTGKLSVYYTIDEGERVLLAENLGDAAVWTEHTANLPAACNNHFIHLYFKAISEGSDGYFHIDDILITCEETCPKPTLDEPVVTNNSVAVTWTAGASETEWQYICQPSADLVDWNGSAVKSATSASAELADLEPATDYTFYLRAKCAEEDFSAVVSKDFRSGCAESIATLNCGFETTEGYKNGELPECWTTLFVTTPAVAPAVTTDAAEYGSQHLRITGSETGQIVVLPKFNQEVKNLQISFKYKRTLGAALYLATLTDPENKATMKVFTSSAFSDGYTYTAVEEYEMTSAREGDHYLAFYYYSSTNATLYIDDIVVEPIPPCKAPTNLYQSEEATVTTVELAWTENGSATEWLIQLSDDNGDTWDAGTKANTNPFQLTGLEPNTSYKARVKAVCGEEESSKWSSEIYFHTEEGTPTALDNANGPSSATKLILNGQLIIKRSDKTYTVTGQEVR